MTQPSENPTFEGTALAQGLITPEQLEECRRVHQNVVAQGLECDLEEVILKKGFVTKAQAMAIHAALGKGNKTAIEGYEIISKLGAGGQGAVYKAKQSSMDRFVAIKVLLPKYARDKDGVQRFLREAKAVARLNHPNIVSGIDAGYSNGIYYYVMEYLDGESLDRRVTRAGKLPWSEAVRILRQMAQALDHAHRNGLVHRDVKPANIILTKEGSAKLTDLGLARFAGKEGLGLTQTGFVVGTPLYISPEQARGETDVDIRSDLYSLGITFYQMLAGSPPYTGTDPLVVLNKHLNETVHFHFPDVPPELLAVGHRLTERDRARRYQSPEQLLEDLEAVNQGRSLPHARTAVRARTGRVTRAPHARPKSPLPLLLAGGGGVVAVVALVVALSGTKEMPREPLPAEPRAAAASAAEAPAAPKEKPVDGAEAGALAALTRVRQYELANPNDLEEIAALYAEAVAKTANTSYSETARKRSEETRQQLLKVVEDRKAALVAEVKSSRDAKRFGAAREALDRRARDFRGVEWREWVSKQRSDLEAALSAEAQALRAASAAAEAKGDHPGAVAALRALAGLGDPALSRESVDRLDRLEAGRRAAEADRQRKFEGDRARLDEFLDQADAWAAARTYEKIEPAAPVMESDRAKAHLRLHLAFYRAGREVLEAAGRHVLTLKGKTTALTTRGGETISGRVSAVQEQPLRLLIGDRACDFGDLSARTLAAYYRADRGSAARSECVISFALYEGDAALVDETLAKSSVELLPRAKKALEELRRKAAEAREAARAKKPEPPAPKRAEGPPREVVIHAVDLPMSALGKDLEVWDDATSPGGKYIGIQNDGDTIGPPPDPDAAATFKVHVQAGLAYRCWVRLKVGPPKKNSQANIVLIQFTHAVDKQGKEVFTLGTRDCIVVKAPAKEGWIWAGKDLTDSRSVEPAVYFRFTGEVTVGIAAGAEGVGFDQFVLSPAQYLTKPPADAVTPKPRK